MDHAATAIIEVSSPNDFDAARTLLARYRRWLEKLVGSDLATVQPSSMRELADLEHFYGPPSGRLLVAAVDGKPAGVVGVHRRGADHGAARSGLDRGARRAMSFEEAVAYALDEDEALPSAAP